MAPLLGNGNRKYLGACALLFIGSAKYHVMLFFTESTALEIWVYFEALIWCQVLRKFA